MRSVVRSSHMSPASVALLAALLLCPAALARAQQGQSLAQCVDDAVALAEAQGASRLEGSVVDFLLPRQSNTYSFSMPDEGCLGLLAVGHRRVHDLALGLHAFDGTLLVRDDTRDPHPYVRYCGAAGEELAATVRMFDGQGEFHLVPLWNAPERLSGLATALSRCVDVGNKRPSLTNVGPEPVGPTIDRSLVLVAKRLKSLGYQSTAKAISGVLPERRREVRQLYLTPGRCYALAVVGGSEVMDIDLRVIVPGPQPTIVASDISRQRDAVVKLCAEAPGSYALDVRMYRGRGDYAIQTYVLDEPTGVTRPPGVEGNMRVVFAEVVSQMQARGMEVAPLGWGVASGPRQMTLAVSLQPGRCYAIGAVPSSEVGSGDLDLALVDEHGELIAWDVGPDSAPLLFHCASHSGTYRAIGRIHGADGPRRFLVMVGQDAPR